MEKVILSEDKDKSEKIIIKIDLDNKRIGTKPLILEDFLTSIREKIKNKVKEQFSFLDKNGKTIKKENESFFKLKNIIYDNNIIKLKCESLSEIKVLMNNINEFIIKASKEEKLENIRNIIKSKLGQDFIFLDGDGNDIDKEDESDYKINDIINNNEIKLSFETFRDAPPVFKNDNYDDKDNKYETPCIEKPSDNKIQFSKFSEITDKAFNNLITYHLIGKEKHPIEKKYSYFKKQKEIDFSKFENYKKLNGITYYKYSKIESQKPIDSVHLYYYDKYNMEFDEDIAYVVLFCGKTGDGKTTAINSFFNIIKGVKREDNYRFILIDEPKKDQKESQTEGVHLYFVKDNNDIPIIIIDSAGYADTRGKEYDEKINKAFSYIFSCLITHINSVSFVVKSTDTRIGTEAKYIFSCVTALFDGNMAENFIFLATHADTYTISEGPKFISSIKAEKDFEFLKLKERKDTWWYSFDSRSIMDNKDNDITKFSFKNFKDFYEKVKTLTKKDIKKSSELLEKRIELKAKANRLLSQFTELFNNKDKLQQKIDIIKSIEDEKNKLSQDPTIEEIENLINNINNLNTKIRIPIKTRRLSNNDHTCCTICLRNCHSPCNCLFRSLTRCHIFPVFGNNCEVCGDLKKFHSQDKNHYVQEYREEESPQIQEQIRILSRFLEKYKDEEIIKNEEKLTQTQLRLNMFEIEKEKIEVEILKINDEIKYNVVTLKLLSERINEIAMNNNAYKAEEDYLSELIEKIRENGILSEDKIKTLKKMKNNLKIILEIIKENRDSLNNLEESNLNNRIRELIEINNDNKSEI